MKLILMITPFFISFLMGYLLIDFFFRKEKKPDIFIHFFLAGGLGLGLSSYITFLSFVCLDHLNKSLGVAIHAVILAVLLLNKFLTLKKRERHVIHLDMKTAAPFLLLLLALIPIWIQAKYYPMGGWDAWSVWNFKAKFLLLAGDEWKNLFDPRLWRSSQHYPLLLPLINVWGWTFTNNALPTVPLITSFLFTFLTVGLLFSILRHLTKSYFAVAAPLLLLTLPFYGTLATSQYSDIVLGYFALAGLYCLIEVIKGHGHIYALLSGLFLGFLSFTKPEGMVAAILMACLAVALSVKANGVHFDKKKTLAILFIAWLLSSLPAIIFQILYSPENQTYVNGFVSQAKPVTLYRIKMIFAFFLMELKSLKWNGIWILASAGVVLSWGKCFRKEILILPLFLALYLSVTLGYYFTNTYFEIKWWLQVSLNRILFSLLPVMLFWVFYSLWQPCLPAGRDEKTS